MNIALVAHDGRKKELMEWVRYNWETLSKHNLYAAGPIGKKIEEIYIGEAKSGYWDEYEWCYDYKDVLFPFRNKINKLYKNSLGGTQQIGAMIAEGKIDVLVSFYNNFMAQGHQNVVPELTRLASLYNIAFATNRTTADTILTSPLFDDPEYKRILPAAIENYKNRQV